MNKLCSKKSYGCFFCSNAFFSRQKKAFFLDEASAVVANSHSFFSTYINSVVVVSDGGGHTARLLRPVLHPRFDFENLVKMTH